LEARDKFTVENDIYKVIDFYKDMNA